MPLCAISCPRYYNSWHQCAHDFSDDEPQCTRLKQWAYSMCPLEWVRRAHPNPARLPASPPPPPSTTTTQVENWQKQREAGNYAGPVPGETKEKH